MQLFISTRGTKGSVFLERAQGIESNDHKLVSMEDVMCQLASQLDQQLGAEEPADADCVSKSGVLINRQAVASTSGAVMLKFSDNRDRSSAAQQAQLSAERAAALNADRDNAGGYTMTQV